MCLKFLAKGKNQISETRMEIHTIIKEIHPRGLVFRSERSAGTATGPNRSRKEQQMRSWWTWVWLWSIDDFSLFNRQRAKMYRLEDDKVEHRMFLSWGGNAGQIERRTK